MRESSFFVFGGSSASLPAVESMRRSLEGAGRLRERSDLHEEAAIEWEADLADGAHRLRVRADDAT